MQRLNYHHLMYFWRIAREGGLAPAGKVLRLSPQTLSGQVRQFEETLGQKVFVRRGRKLALTEVGRVAYQYADEIFSLGEELSDVLERGVLERPQRIHVGLVESLPKMVAQRILAPLMTDDAKSGVVICREGSLDDLKNRLTAHALDVLLADEPLTANPRSASASASPAASGFAAGAAGPAARTFNHLLGETGVTFFASPDLALERRRFPDVLDGVRFLAPLAGSPLRRRLDAFFSSHRITPRIVGEIEDSALIKAFGRQATAVFCAPSIVTHEISEMYNVRPIGSTDEVIERFYAISVERRVKHPAVATMLEQARHQVFG